MNTTPEPTTTAARLDTCDHKECLSSDRCLYGDNAGPTAPTTAATDDGRVTSNRTHERATALAWMRGCEQENGCWPDCYDAALSAVIEDRLDDVERTWATTSTYWKLTHGVSPRDI